MNITTKQGTIFEYNSLICKGKVKTIDDFNRYKSVPWEKEAYKRGDKYKL